MRIGELAALVGVSTRAVRHYHHLGVLPEPERLANGYREYRLRDAVVLARVRRLTELGLSLGEVRDVLADGRGRELREVLLELDADLARQQEALRERRERLAELLTRTDLDADSTVPAQAAAVLKSVAPGDSRFADLDREMLTLVASLGAEEDQERFLAMLAPLTDPEVAARSRALYARLDELEDAPADDPRTEALARDLAAHLPEPMARLMAGDPADEPRMRALLEELPPAQAEVFRILSRILNGTL
ncbi:MerR family transcriptional regulator [Actinomadura litoris]|uniref:MerR family transcriptional regulator n=1 Tax=Actinomadura litoris TaxID=2678616 RepID=UPI001FA6D746|nr:MerR family transcriptional regulator [Actinomadura litoris]